MFRTVLALAGVLLATTAALANAPPTPTKVVPLDHKITTDKEFPDYDFYLVGQKTVLPVKLDPKTPIELKSKPGEVEIYRLIALPKDAAKKFATEKELHRALLSDDGVAGQIQATGHQFDPTTRTVLRDDRKRILIEQKVERIDPKKGILLSPPIAPKTDGKKDSPDDSDAPSAAAPRGGMLVAGLSAFAALTLGGFWLLGRTRRKV